MLSGIGRFSNNSYLPKDLNNFQSLLGNGQQFGIEISYAEQSSPDGKPKLLLLAKNLLVIRMWL